MDEWIAILLPFALLLARVSGFLAVAPVFGANSIPVRMRVALLLAMTIFFAYAIPPQPAAAGTHWMVAMILIITESLCGLTLGFAARLVYLGVQQGGLIAGRQMGLMMARVIDPTTGERNQPVGVLFQLSFLLLFVIAGGHHLLLRVLARSYVAFPVGATPDVGAVTEGIVSAGSAMLLLGLRLAGPVLAAFMILGVLLAVLARVLPEMNLLVASLPLRVGLGLLMAAAILPLLDSFTFEVADWIKRFLAT